VTQIKDPSASSLLADAYIVMNWSGPGLNKIEGDVRVSNNWLLGCEMITIYGGTGDAISHDRGVNRLCWDGHADFWRYTRASSNDGIPNTGSTEGRDLRYSFRANLDVPVGTQWP
jgi:hypothetical protein